MSKEITLRSTTLGVFLGIGLFISGSVFWSHLPYNLLFSNADQITMAFETAQANVFLLIASSFAFAFLSTDALKLSGQIPVRGGLVFAFVAAIIVGPASGSFTVTFFTAIGGITYETPAIGFIILGSFVIFIGVYAFLHISDNKKKLLIPLVTVAIVCGCCSFGTILFKELLYVYILEANGFFAIIAGFLALIQDRPNIVEIGYITQDEAIFSSRLALGIVIILAILPTLAQG